LFNIGVIGPKESINNIKNIIEDLDFDFKVSTYSYDSLPEIIEIYRNNIKQWDYLLLSGILLYVYLNHNLKKIEVPNDYINLDERKQNTPFEKIDAEKYYPVYGDDSQVVSETNTAGKLYLKLESEELNAIWGNYKLNYDNNKLINLRKNIYGANIDYDNGFDFNTFWYQPFSTQTRDELELTGGILYYLRQAVIKYLPFIFPRK